MRIEMVLKDVGIGENGSKVQVVLKYSPVRPRIRLQRRHL